MRNTATVFFLVADSDTFFSYGIHGGLFLDLSIAHDSRKSVGSLELLVIQVVRWRLQLGSGFSVCGVLFTTKHGYQLGHPQNLVGCDENIGEYWE